MARLYFKIWKNLITRFLGSFMPQLLDKQIPLINKGINQQKSFKKLRDINKKTINLNLIEHGFDIGSFSLYI